MLSAKFGSIWPAVSEEKIKMLKVYDGRTTDGRTDDGRQTTDAK